MADLLAKIQANSEKTYTSQAHIRYQLDDALQATQMNLISVRQGVGKIRWRTVMLTDKQADKLCTAIKNGAYLGLAGTGATVWLKAVSEATGNPVAKIGATAIELFIPVSHAFAQANQDEARSRLTLTRDIQLVDYNQMMSSLGNADQTVEGQRSKMHDADERSFSAVMSVNR